jgi:hypothetical protein
MFFTLKKVRCFNEFLKNTMLSVAIRFRLTINIMRNVNGLLLFVVLRKADRILVMKSFSLERTQPKIFI